MHSVGGVLNGTTFFDRTNYFETLPSNYLALGLWLESDRMGFFLPALTQEKLDIQREVVKEERRQRYDNVPYGTAFERLLHLAYDPDYSYHWPTIGSMEDLGAASLDDIRQFFDTWYRPDNAVLTTRRLRSEEAKILSTYFAVYSRPLVFCSQIHFDEKADGRRADANLHSPVQLPRVYMLITARWASALDFRRPPLDRARHQTISADLALVHEKQIARCAHMCGWSCRPIDRILLLHQRRNRCFAG